jgi:hypothetical protein
MVKVMVVSNTITMSKAVMKIEYLDLIFNVDNQPAKRLNTQNIIVLQITQKINYLWLISRFSTFQNRTPHNHNFCICMQRLFHPIQTQCCFVHASNKEHYANNLYLHFPKTFRTFLWLTHNLNPPT